MSGAGCSLFCAIIRLEYELEKLLAIAKFGIVTLVTVATMYLLIVALVVFNYLNFATSSALIVLTGAAAIVVNRILPREIAEKKLRLKYGEKIDECLA